MISSSQTMIIIRFPEGISNETTTDYDISMVKEDVSYSDSSDGYVVYCSPTLGILHIMPIYRHLNWLLISGQPTANVTTGWIEKFVKIMIQSMYWNVIF